MPHGLRAGMMQPGFTGVEYNLIHIGAEAAALQVNRR